MKIEEYVPAADCMTGLNTTARVPFVMRAKNGETFCGREEMVTDAREFGKKKARFQETQVNVLTEELGIEKQVLMDEEASASMIAKQGLIHEYTENLKNVDLHDLEQVMQELHQDCMLQKYQYFVGNV